MYAKITYPVLILSVDMPSNMCNMILHFVPYKAGLSFYM